MNSVGQADAELRRLKDYWHSRLSRYAAQTPDPALNSMVNVWNAYNALVTFNWSRAASLIYMGGDRDGLGYRDSVQDTLGAIPLIPEDARQRLELMLSGQVSTGGAMPVVKQFNHKPGKETPPTAEEYRSDDSMWLFNAVPQYIKETGDLKFFDKVVPYADTGQATVLEHLKRAIEFSLERRGAHGLPCGLLADWNDCLKLGHRGESVFVAFQLRYAVACYREISLLLKRDAEFDWSRQKLNEIDKAIQKCTWDGGWFVRAFREDGSVIGTRREREGSLFLNSQAWAVISGAASPEQATRAMDSVKQHLATPWGIELCAPPFVKTDYHVVRAVLFNPGTKENAGIFSHPQSWAVIAETMLGRGTRAYEYYRAYMPSAQNDKAEIRQIEPYVHCQSTHARPSRRYGTSRLPWLSGTAAWSYLTATQYILGIRPEYEGLLIDPCIPAAWDGFTVRRQFRGAVYQIKVENPDHVEKGVKALTVAGKELDPSRPIPAARAGEVVDVKAVMGAVPA
jgi:cellobiose phosphorylase